MPLNWKARAFCKIIQKVCWTLNLSWWLLPSELHSLKVAMIPAPCQTSFLETLANCWPLERLVTLIAVLNKKKKSTGHLGFRIWKVLCVSSSCRVFPGLPSGADWSCFSPFPLILAGIWLASSRLTSLPEPRWATGVPRAESIDKHSTGISWVGIGRSGSGLTASSSPATGIQQWEVRAPLRSTCVISHRTDKAKPALEQNKITQPSPRQSFGNMKCDRRMGKLDLKIN